MSNIASAFANGKAFIPFITCGDPDLETTIECIKAMADNGADLIELGIPFSDPTAEGPVIMEANERALIHKITTDDVFDMVREVRKTVKVPMVFMTYANVIYNYGIECFAKAEAELGMDGLILPDIPYEEKHEFSDAFNAEGLDFVSLIAPTSEQRVEMIAKESQGFVYCVSSLGVTGMRTSLSDAGKELAAKVHSYTDTPACVGFGISNPDQAKAMCEEADGVIVGSAIVKIIAEHGKDAAPYVGKFVKEMKDAIS